jgi:hypothetical protein
MTHLMDSVVKTVNFVFACALTIVALLGDVESEHDEIMYHTYVRWVFQQFLIC